MLLYLLKHSRIDLGNPVGELTKVLKTPTMLAYKEMLRTIKLVLDTATMELKLVPTLPNANLNGDFLEPVTVIGLMTRTTESPLWLSFYSWMEFPFCGVLRKPALLLCQQLRRSTLLWVIGKRNPLCGTNSSLTWHSCSDSYHSSCWQHVSNLHGGECHQQSKDTSHWCKTQVPNWPYWRRLPWCRAHKLGK